MKGTGYYRSFLDFSLVTFFLSKKESDKELRLAFLAILLRTSKEML
jgi:hypothetical protein